MKMRKRFAALALAAVMAVTSVVPAWAAEKNTDANTLTMVTESYTNGSSASALRPKNGIWTSPATGRQYYYRNSQLVKNKRGYKIGKNYYKISSKGVLKRVSEAEGLAGIRMDKLKGSTYEAFKWCADFRYRVIKVPAGKKASEFLGTYGLKYKAGDCLGQAYAFYWLAKARGYNVRVVKGYVPQANGKFGEHAWCEIRQNGKTYVCDPNLASTYHNQKGYKFAYKFRYGAKGTYKYYDQNKKYITKK